ncbi:hypothetical protein HUN08_03660 [Gordonia sp. X0973]|uniref:hypothetical protein n=1 Tax=Gordonia sp. X0973 TaxID=2742602 RepID=UPI000F543959|nr:hypothetical protein [Gordonia sp. X0973]QKT06386.1 hypothetical protein HUN08_03660 [Gordonia sp. X0973]
MDVIDHEPHWWFLLRDGDDLLLDVNCSHGPVGYAWLMVLNESERREFEADGRAALGRLADAIQNSAPVLEDSTSVYRGRDVSHTRNPAVTDAVARWRARHAGSAENPAG